MNELDTLTHAKLPNGVSLAYERAGAGTPLVFIHGVMGDWASWQPQWSAFCARYDCVRYSRRYNYPNENSMPSPHHSALVEAEDLRLFLDHLHLERAILVGSSYGAFIALALAVQHPERCLALALAEPPMMKYAAMSEAGRAAERAFREQTIEPANAAFRTGDDARGAAIMTGGIAGAAAAALSAEAMQRRIKNVRSMKMLALSSDEFPLLPPAQLRALPMPILLLAGRNTPAIHAEIFKNVCAAMPNAQHAWIDGAGHATSRDQPEVFNRMVLEFLQSHV